jgi:hypothetical protein
VHYCQLAKWQQRPAKRCATPSTLSAADTTRCAMRLKLVHKVVRAGGGVGRGQRRPANPAKHRQRRVAIPSTAHEI